MLIGEAVLPQAGEARTFLRIGSVSDDRRHLELELLLQQTVPGKLVSADEPHLLQELEEMGFDPARHAALANSLTQLLSKKSAIRDEAPHGEPAITEPSQQSNAVVVTNSQTSAPEGSETESVADTAISYLKDFKVDGVLQADTDEEDADSSKPQDLESGLNDAERSPVIDLVDRILMQALELGASDIHVEPQQAGLQLRFRQDGVLQSHIEPLPSRMVPAVTSRLKIMADLDIAERRIAQDGRIRRRFQNRTVDFRVNSLPSRFGEKIVLRLLDSSATQLGLDKLISNPRTLELVRALGSKPFGMILVTGPTGSGKSTTLYSLLAERNEPGINISTVEDPIEYTLPGITQCQVNREKGFDFSQALHASR